MENFSPPSVVVVVFGLVVGKAQLLTTLEEASAGKVTAKELSC